MTHLVIRCIKAATAGALVIRLGTRVQSTAKRAATNQGASVELKILFAGLVKRVVHEPTLAFELGLVRQRAALID